MSSCIYLPTTDGPLSVTLDPARDRVAVPAGELLPTITCSALCNPGCSYSWVKDDASEALTRGRTLTLDRVTQSSAGIYKCVATNPHGTANNKFELAVQCKLLLSSCLLGLTFSLLYITSYSSFLSFWSFCMCVCVLWLFFGFHFLHAGTLTSLFYKVNL